MSNQHLTFRFATQSARVIKGEGVPWFVAADVYKMLAIANNRDASARLDDGERGAGIIDASPVNRKWASPTNPASTAR